MGVQPSRKPVFPPAIAPYIDVGAYLLDARAPAATLYLDGRLAGKELLLLTRASQADVRATRRWQKYLQAAGFPCLVIDAVSRAGLEEVLDYLAGLLGRKQAVGEQRGIRTAVLRMAALGVPNVGKSTFLNALLGRKRLKTGNRPGITRGHQWVRLFEDVEVLDTPGVLRDPTALNRRKPYWTLLNLLPYDSTLREQAVELLRTKLEDHGWRKLLAYYKIPEEHAACADWLQLLETVARKRGAGLDSEDETDRAARRLIRDFQRGRFGRVTLELPGEAAISSPFFEAPDNW